MLWLLCFAAASAWASRGSLQPCFLCASNCRRFSPPWFALVGCPMVTSNVLPLSFENHEQHRCMQERTTNKSLSVAFPPFLSPSSCSPSHSRCVTFKRFAHPTHSVDPSAFRLPANRAVRRWGPRLMPSLLLPVALSPLSSGRKWRK
ncbi:unnamed protein product [Scytosiphon promiscuus]